VILNFSGTSTFLGQVTEHFSRWYLYSCY